MDSQTFFYACVVLACFPALAILIAWLGWSPRDERRLRDTRKTISARTSAPRPAVSGKLRGRRRGLRFGNSV